MMLAVASVPKLSKSLSWRSQHPHLQLSLELDTSSWQSVLVVMLMPPLPVHAMA